MGSDLPRPLRREFKKRLRPIDRRPVGRVVRRKRVPDAWVRAPRWIGALAWGLALCALAWADTARPNWRGFGLDAFFGVRRRGYWDPEILQTASVMMALAFVMCGVALAVRSRRMRRTEDRVPWSLFLLMLLAGAAAIGFSTVTI